MNEIWFFRNRYSTSGLWLKYVIILCFSSEKKHIIAHLSVITLIDCWFAHCTSLNEDKILAQVVNTFALSSVSINIFITKRKLYDSKTKFQSWGSYCYLFLRVASRFVWWPCLWRSYRVPHSRRNSWSPNQTIDFHKPDASPCRPSCNGDAEECL